MEEIEKNRFNNYKEFQGLNFNSINKGHPQITYFMNENNRKIIGMNNISK